MSEAREHPRRQPVKALWLFLMLLGHSAWAGIQFAPEAFRPLAKNFDQGGYFAVNLPLKAFAAALAEAEKIAGAPLQTRGEAHLTVVTPPEYMRLQPIQREGLLKDLKALDWSRAAISAVCLGRGQAEVKGRSEFAYYVVLKAEALKTLREKYGLREFYPHVTLGFTKRDLHIEDGVHKDATSCLPSR